MAPLLNEEELSIDPYELLGLKTDSTELEAQKAYRKMSLKCHPDRNPNNPSAAHQFHLISLALSILTDPSKRSFLNTRHADALAKSQRTAAMDGKRREMVEALLAREKEAEVMKVRRMEEKVALGEEERVKEQGKRMRERMAKEQEEVVERESKRVRREAKHTSTHHPHPTSSKNLASSSTADPDPQPPIDPLDLTLSLQCPPILPPSTIPLHLTSSSSLQSHLSNVYGSVAHVLLKPGSSSTTAATPTDSASTSTDTKIKRKKVKGPTAVIEFPISNWAGCWACWKDNSSPSPSSSSTSASAPSPATSVPGTSNAARSQTSKMIANGAILKWATGEEPAWVGWAERRHAGSGMGARSSVAAAAGDSNEIGNDEFVMPGLGKSSGQGHPDNAPGSKAINHTGTGPSQTAPTSHSTFPSTFPSSFPTTKPAASAPQPSRNVYEEDTLFKMRQAEYRRDEERRRLEEEIRREDEA